MRICTACMKEMTCSRTGVLVVLYGGAHAYAGDEFQCKTCGSRFIDTNASGFRPDVELVEAKAKEGRLEQLRV